MRILQITPGAGEMYCGNCLRDNALVVALRERGHEVLMLPVYLPLTLDEPDQSAGNRIFFSGINVFLDQQWPAFARAPAFIRRFLSSRLLLRWAAGRAAKTRPQDVGALTLSMLRGESGHQARDLEDMLIWLRTQPKPDLVILSNALLVGMARRLKRDLATRVVCHLGGEDSFLDALPESHRAAYWATVSERTRELDLLLAPTRYFGELMGGRLGISQDRIALVPNGINLNGYEGAPIKPAQSPPVLGFFTRMCREKGLDLLVRAFIEVRRRGTDLRLKVGGSCGPMDQLLVIQLQEELAAAGVADHVSWHLNLDRPQKIEFLKSLSLFSAPAVYGEAFGLYVIEAMAAGVPVIQPETASFPELIAATGGGVLCSPNNVEALATAIQDMASNPVKAAALGEAARLAVIEKFSAAAMAKATEEAILRVASTTKDQRPAQDK